MPALNLFGRRWLIAGDDVPAPAIFLAIFHLVRAPSLPLFFKNSPPSHPTHPPSHRSGSVSSAGGWAVLKAPKTVKVSVHTTSPLEVSYSSFPVHSLSRSPPPSSVSVVQSSKPKNAPFYPTSSTQTHSVTLHKSLSTPTPPISSHSALHSAPPQQAKHGTL